MGGYSAVIRSLVPSSGRFNFRLAVTRLIETSPAKPQLGVGIDGPYTVYLTIHDST
jgi:hypothetical protein